MKHEDIYWRKAKLAALILKRAQRAPLSERDRRLANHLAADEGVTNRLIHQARLSRVARQKLTH